MIVRPLASLLLLLRLLFLLLLKRDLLLKLADEVPEGEVYFANSLQDVTRLLRQEVHEWEKEWKEGARAPHALTSASLTAAAARDSLFGAQRLPTSRMPNPVSQVTSMDRPLAHSHAPESVRLLRESVADSSRTTSNYASTTKSKQVKRRSRAFDRKSWNFLSFDYKAIDKVPVPLLSHMSLLEQESVLVHDLLHVLVGIEGNYIKLHPHEDSKKCVLLVDDGADKLLKTLADKIIAICPLYSSVIHFVDDNDHGLVNQALAAAIRSVLKDYFNMIAQLESHFRKGSLTMQTMWYYLQGWMANLEILKHCSSAINTGKVSGGAVLDILHNKTVGFKANTKLLEFCYTVTRDACVPYLEILEKWISEGRIDDPHHEFFIEDMSASSGDALPVAADEEDDSFWNSRYRLNLNKMPKFLSSYRDKILKTGKYLSVIREYGKEMESPVLQEPLAYSVEEKEYSSRVDSAFQSASRQLLSLLTHDADLLGHLQSVKHFFLLDQGDFIVNFVDMAEEELHKSVGETNPSRLNSLLELAIKTSVLRSDVYHENVHISLMQESLFKQLMSIMSAGRREQLVFPREDQLKGFEALVMEYDVKWPLNLVLSEKSITCYQILFRHLFMCHNIERQLLSVWMDNRTARTYALKAVTGYSEAFALRQKMLLFLHNRTFFLLVAVVEPHYRSFLSRLTSFSQVDELAQEHINLVYACLRDSLLSQEFALNYLIRLLELCTSFAQFMQVSAASLASRSPSHSSLGVTQAVHAIRAAAVQPPCVASQAAACREEQRVPRLRGAGALLPRGVQLHAWQVPARDRLSRAGHLLQQRPSHHLPVRLPRLRFSLSR